MLDASRAKSPRLADNIKSAQAEWLRKARMVAADIVLCESPEDLMRLDFTQLNPPTITFGPTEHPDVEGSKQHKQAVALAYHAADRRVILDAYGREEVKVGTPKKGKSAFSIDE